MAPKLRVGVIFGGRSAEREVSLVSAASVINALDKTKYEIVPIGTISYFVLSRALITEAAETRETSRSADRPPKITPTLSLGAIPVLSAFSMDHFPDGIAYFLVGE